MSDALAISAVTAMLHRLLTLGLQLDDAIAGTMVTTQPLDKARDTMTVNQVNLYLYHTAVNPAWRNMDIPWRTRSGETAQTPLALNLYYLLTAFYGEGEDNIDTTTDATRLLGSHRLLGRAMSVLHDYAVLDADAIQSVLPTQDQLEHPYDQIECIRITPQPLTLDEVSKLWSSFQSQFRLSVAYEVSVVLIESVHNPKTPLPVLRRGSEDQGVQSQPDLIPPYPTLTEIELPERQPAILPGQTLTLHGHHLAGDDVTLQFTHAQLDDPLLLVPDGELSDTTISLTLPDTPDAWPAGVYSVAAIVDRAGDQARTTNELAFAVAPRLTVTAVTPAADPCDFSLEAACQPDVWPAQHVSILIGSQAFPADVHPAQTDTLTFCLKDVPSGSYFVRLRVDGVDSLLIDYTAVPPVFDESQKVTIP